MADRSSFVMSMIFAVIGTGILIAGSILLFRGVSTNSWETVVGTVVSSSARPSSDNPGEIGTLDIVYKYNIDGKQYSNEKLSYYPGLSEAMQQRLYSELRVGEPAVIYYNPSRPEMTVLLRGYHPSFFILPSAGLVFLLTGIFLFRHEIKNKNKEISLAERINMARKEPAVIPKIGDIRTFTKKYSYPRFLISKAGAVFAVILGIFVMAFPLTVAFISEDPESIKAAFMATAIFGFIGLILIITILNTLYSKITVNINGDSIEYYKRSLFKREIINEKLSNYKFITPKFVQSRSQFGSFEGSKYYCYILALMVHREDPKKDIGIRLQTRPRDTRTMLNSPNPNSSLLREIMIPKVEQFAEEILIPVRRFPEQG